MELADQLSATRSSSAAAAASEESSSFLLSKAGRRYIQLWEVVCGPGTECVRSNVLRKLDQPTLRKSLDDRRQIFQRLLKQNKIYDTQFKILFPRNRSDPDLSLIDISLWVVICKTVTVHRRDIDWSRKPTDSDVSWEHDAVRLRDVRNHLSHLIQPKFTDDDYRQHGDIVRQALFRLGVSTEDLTRLFTDDDSFVLSEEAKNYLILRVLVVEVGTERVRYHVLKNLHHDSVHEAVVAEKSKLINDISPFQRTVLYPDNNRKTFETEIDISLWTVIAKKLLGPDDIGSFDWSPNPQPDQVEWFHDVCRVRDVRNMLVHLPRPTVAADEFSSLWTNVTGALLRLGADKELINSYREKDVYGMQTEQLSANNFTFKFMRREQWAAREPAKPLEEFGNVPARFVILSHIVYAIKCYNTYECCMQVKNIQRYHIDERKFDDIAFNFVVANDGVVYEGRGSQYIGSTALGWNRVSLGVAYLGEFIASDEHCQRAVESLRLFLSYLICQGKLQPNYILYGLRQVRPMHDAPKKDLYEEIQKWPEWREYTTEM